MKQKEIKMIRNKMVSGIAATAIAASLVLAGCGGEQKAETAKTKEKPAEVAKAVTAYPIDWCLVSGEKLGSMGDPIVVEHAGREIKFCCQMCVDPFKADPAAYIAKLDSAAAGLLKGPAEAPAEETGHEGHDHGA
jgi:hypothetical protein